MKRPSKKAGTKVVSKSKTTTTRRGERVKRATVRKSKSTAYG